MTAVTRPARCSTILKVSENMFVQSKGDIKLHAKFSKHGSRLDSGYRANERSKVEAHDGHCCCLTEHLSCKDDLAVCKSMHSAAAVRTCCASILFCFKTSQFLNFGIAFRKSPCITTESYVICAESKLNFHSSD